MRRLVVPLVFGLVVLGACGDGSTADPKVLGHTFERPSVSGAVRRNGVAVVGARVVLGPTAREAVTDASGSYRFDAVEAGSYRVTVTDTGDSSSVCGPSGACITAESARHAAVEVVVGDEPVVADVEL